MAFHVRDPATDLAVRSLAKLKGKSLTQTIREAGLGLGIPRWRTTLSIVLRTAAPGVNVTPPPAVAGRRA